jgi:purine-binding chemotaxis protein CheW
MTRTAVQIDEQVQAARSEEGKYLTFAFPEKGHDKKLQLEVVGWVQLEAWSGKSENVKGIVKLWGHEILVVCPKTLSGRDTAEMADTACIIIYEFSERYLGMVVDAISNVMNIAGKDPETVAIIETKIVDELGSEQLEYSIVERVDELV